MTFDANNSVQLQEARADLRIRLDEIAEREFRDEELDRWINLGQYDTWLQLKQITSIWYGKNAQVAIAGYTGTLPADCGDIKKCVYEGTLLPMIDYKDLEGYRYSSIYGSRDFVAQRGQQIITTASGLIATGLYVYYYAKPAELTSDTDYLNVPEEFHDIVIMFAQTKAMQKLGLAEQKQATEKDIGNRLDAIRSAYMNEMQMEEYRKNLYQQGR